MTTKKPAETEDVPADIKEQAEAITNTRLPAVRYAELTEIDFSKLVSLGEEEVERARSFFGNDAKEDNTFIRARRTYRNVRRSLPMFNALINTQCSIHAWNYSLAGFYMAKAKEAGLTTPKGMSFLKLYSKFAKEAEKAALVLYEVAAKYAKDAQNLSGSTKGDDPINWFVPKTIVTKGEEVKEDPNPLPEPDQDDDEEEDSDEEDDD